MIVLGINAFHADASAALLRDGMLVAAIEEERLNRKKHAAGFPALAITAVLEIAGVRPTDIDHVAISRDPRAHLPQKILFAATRGTRLFEWSKRRVANAGKVLSVERMLAEALRLEPGTLRAEFHHVEHHKAHIASAFYASGMNRAACLSIDGFGDFLSLLRGSGSGTRLSFLDDIGFPHSAGMFYTAITHFLGFHKFGEEWKLMGLAPYGEPRYLEEMRRIIKPTPDGGYELELKYFKHHTDGAEMSWEDGSPTVGRVWSDRLPELLGPARDPADPEFFGKWADLARSAQDVYEDIFFHVLRDLQQRTSEENLCLAGGCALNSSANGKIIDQTKFRRVFIQPAAGDNGTAVGAALFVEHAVLNRPRLYEMHHAYLGPSFDDQAIELAIERTHKEGANESVAIRHVADDELFSTTADAVAAGRVVGWFQGAMEFGPRALGHRSIVADPRRAEMKDILNERIKHRETYRPFAPSILEEQVGEYFERSEHSPFMLMVYRVRPEMRKRVPAITHVNGTGRLQTVSVQHSPRYHALITAFWRKTGVPLVLNTSFNEHEPIVCTPTDALNCFFRTRMDLLSIGNWMLSRRD